MKHYSRCVELFNELKAEADRSSDSNKIRVMFATALARLAEYREDENNGLLVRFPYATGTKVFIVDQRGHIPANLPAKYITKVQEPHNPAQHLCQLLDGSGLMVLTDKVFETWEDAQKEVLSKQSARYASPQPAAEPCVSEPSDSTSTHVTARTCEDDPQEGPQPAGEGQAEKDPIEENVSAEKTEIAETNKADDATADKAADISGEGEADPPVAAEPVNLDATAINGANAPLMKPGGTWREGRGEEAVESLVEADDAPDDGASEDETDEDDEDDSDCEPAGGTNGSAGSTDSTADSRSESSGKKPRKRRRKRRKN